VIPFLVEKATLNIRLDGDLSQCGRHRPYFPDLISSRQAPVISMLNRQSVFPIEPLREFIRNAGDTPPVTGKLAVIS